MKWRNIILGTIAMGWALASVAAYPERAITWVVPFPAGGGVDVTARTVGKFLSDELQQPIVIENRPGPGGTIGAAYVAKAPADGYTLLAGASGPLMIAPFVIKGIQYDPQKDFKAISMFVAIPQILVVKNEGKYKNFADYVKATETKPLTIGYGSNGTTQHLSALALTQKGHLNLKLVPYKGTSNVINDLLGGTIDSAIVDPSARGLIDSGELLALAVTTPTRSSFNPAIPTLNELGVHDASITTYYALAAPVNVDSHIIDITSNALKKVLAKPEVIEALRSQGLDVRFTTPDETTTLINNDIRYFGQLLKDFQE